MHEQYILRLDLHLFIFVNSKILQRKGSQNIAGGSRLDLEP